MGYGVSKKIVGKSIYLAYGDEKDYLVIYDEYTDFVELVFTVKRRKWVEVTDNAIIENVVEAIKENRLKDIHSMSFPRYPERKDDEK